MAETQRTLDFAEIARKGQSGEHLSIVFFGGSLTWGAQASDPQLTSYRALVARAFEKTYPHAHFQFWDAGLGGTGSQLGAFRLDRDVLSRKPDLVFLDFTVNDDPYSSPSPARLSAYESLVRRLAQAGVAVVPVILPVKGDVLPDPPLRPLDASHQEIAAAYHLPVADAVALAKARVATGETTPDQLWDVPEDLTHPGDAGYALYAEAAWLAFQRAASEKLTDWIPDKMLHANTYMTITRCRLSSFRNLPEGWSAGKPHRTAIAYDFVCSRWMDDLVIAEWKNDTAPAPLRLNVQASDILLFGEGTPKSGGYEVLIDGGKPATYQTACAQGNLRHVQLIAEGLDPSREHHIEIVAKLDPGQELRVEGICIAGGAARAELL